METVNLGGNIELNGFSKLDGGTMVILKKIIGNHTKHLHQVCKHFKKVSLTINVPKEIDNAGNKNLFELKGLVVDGEQEFTFESKAANLFVAVDDVMKKLESNFQAYKEELKSD